MCYPTQAQRAWSDAAKAAWLPSTNFCKTLVVTHSFNLERIVLEVWVMSALCTSVSHARATVYNSSANEVARTRVCVWPSMEGATKQSSQLEEEAPYDVPLEMRMPEAIVSVRREMHILLAAETQRSLARFASFRNTSLSSARPVSPTARRPTTYRTAAPPRLVETLMEMKARQSAELSSRFVTKIPAGVRLLVVDSRVTSEGSERICVAHVDSAEPIGWVTARRKRLSEPILRELKMTRSSSPSSEENSLAHEGSEVLRELRPPDPVFWLLSFVTVLLETPKLEA